MVELNDKPMLAVDCSTAAASIALAVGGAVFAKEIPHGSQAALLVPEIDALLKAHGVRYAALSTILTTMGPGSFTGLRIALAAVHALALAHGIPVRAITSLQSVAYTVPEATFHVALPAGKGEVFVQAFVREGDAPVARGEIALMQPDAMPAGTISDRVPHATTLCRMADHLPTLPLAEILPLYIRPPDAKPGQLPPWLQNR